MRGSWAARPSGARSVSFVREAGAQHRAGASAVLGVFQGQRPWGDIDYPSRLVVPLLRAEPRFVGLFAKAMFRRKP